MKEFWFKEGEKLDELVNYLLSFKKIEAILLDGELGAGKTTLTAQIAKKLGESKAVVSPTFNTIICYDKMVHIDAYKLVGDLFPYEEYFEDKIVVIEWSKNIIHNFKYYFNIEVSLHERDGQIFHLFKITKQTCYQGLFIETSLPDFCIALTENGNVIDHILIEKLIKKTDKFFESIDELLGRNNTKLNYLDNLYITNGPGSFTGTRLAFVFASTNKLLQNVIAKNDIKIFIAPTYDLFFKQLNLDVIYIKANRHKAYEVIKTNLGITINLVDSINSVIDFNYQNFFKNFSKYVDLFRESNDILKEELIYASDPQIGGV
ncbi:tRNA (adenosine(37)-N6)-threonylcarbamoyltransferase complex ATPase subunit type 1 TsaE [Mycoplasma sp. 1781]